MSHILYRVDQVLRDPRWAPRWGWHDDHRHADKTPDYLPAVQQVRGECGSLIEALEKADAFGGRCLQLGMGECDASHELWRVVFSRVVTLDFRVFADQDVKMVPGGHTASPSTVGFAAVRQPFDFLFIDAGHDFDSVKRDHEIFSQMVRPGGIIAFHDALPRDTYPEIEVWKYLQTLPGVTTAGNEVGTAWIVKD